MTKDVLTKLSEKATNSWALWDDYGNEDFDFFANNIEKLNSQVIFIGLNRSTNKDKDNRKFQNFHTKHHTGDNRLKKFIQENKLENLIGGFMTDISETIESNSEKVEITQNDFNDFLENIKNIPSSQRYIICFGNDVFNCLKKVFNIDIKEIKSTSEINLKEFSVTHNNENWLVYRVWHYSNYGIHQKYSTVELPEQLKYINNMIHHKN